MSALQYFDLLDEILVNQTNERGFVENNYDSKTIMFMELMSYKGKLQRELLYFLSWLISNNDRELYFSAQCNIKFIHMQSSLELLKVTIFINSRCLVHRRLNEWTGRILISWQRNCEKRSLQKINQIGGEIEKTNWGYSDESFFAENTNKITESEHSTKSSFLDAPSQLLSEGQKSTNLDEEGNNSTLSAEEVPATMMRKSVSFHSSQMIEPGITSVANVSKGQELVNDVYGMLEAVEAKVLKLKSIYSEGLVDNLSVGRVLHELRGLTVEESDGIRPCKRLEKAIFHAKQQIESIESSAAQRSQGPPPDTPSAYHIKEQESDWDLVQFQQISTTNEDRSQNATTVESTGSSISSSDPNCAIAVKNNIPFQKSQSSPALKDDSSAIGKVQSTPDLRVATISRNKSFSHGSNSDLNSIRGTKEQHPFFLNQAPHVKEQHSSSDGMDYHYIMNRVQSSDSISSLGATSVDIQESQAVYLDVDNESLTTSGNEGSRAANLSLKPTTARRRSSNIDFSALPSDSNELITIFNIQLRSVFDGELVAKKSSSDFMFKKRYLWINPSTRSIHWGKSLSQKDKSKFYMLTRSRVGKRPIGHIKGVVHSVEFGPMGISICTESSQCLELKLPPASVKDWKRVFLALI